MDSCTNIQHSSMIKVAPYGPGIRAVAQGVRGPEFNPS